MDDIFESPCFAAKVQITNGFSRAFYTTPGSLYIWIWRAFLRRFLNNEVKKNQKYWGFRWSKKICIIFLYKKMRVADP